MDDKPVHQAHMKHVQTQHTASSKAHPKRDTHCLIIAAQDPTLFGAQPRDVRDPGMSWTLGAAMKSPSVLPKLLFPPSLCLEFLVKSSKHVKM